MADKQYNPSELCYKLLKHYEGCKLEAYKCSANKITIGYGNTYYTDGKPVKMGDKITQKQAEEMLPLILNTYALSVFQLVKTYIKQHQFDALVCLAYNIGIGNFEKSTLLKIVNKGGSLVQIEAEFMKWNKARVNGVLTPLDGLTYRRKSEYHLYSTGEVKFFN